MSSSMTSIELRMIENLAISEVPDDTIISFPQSQPVELALLSTRESLPGAFGILPTELLHILLLQLDLESLDSVRLVNYACRKLIDNLTEYQNLRMHASDAIRAIREGHILNVHSIGAIHAALVSKFCVFCGDFGPCLFIPTCERCCLNCTARHPALRLIPLKYTKYFRLRCDDVSDFRSIRRISGHYRCRAFNGRMDSHEPEVLVLLREVEAKAISIHGSRESLDAALVNDFLLSRGGSQNPMFVHYPNRRPRYTPEDDDFYPSVLEAFRFLGCVRFPSLNAQSGEAQNGLWCLACGCQSVPVDITSHDGSWVTWKRWPIEFARAFDHDNFLNHVKQCLHATKLWSSVYGCDGSL